MVLVEIDSSAILVEPIKNGSNTELTRAYSTLMSRLHKAGVAPRKHVLDNEISSSMKALITEKYKMAYELVPPGCHHRNAAEVAIRYFKAHFLSILAGVADDIPFKLWYKLLPQAEITINLLRQSNATPAVSAYAHLSGPFNYNKMPLAPMGCKVQVHEKTDTRGTWVFHSVDGWYVGTSREHYRTHRCHIKATGNQYHTERLSDTVSFQPKSITNPSIMPADKLMQAIADCAAALRGTTSPSKDITQLQHLLSMMTAHAHIKTTVPILPVNMPDLQSVPRVNTPDITHQHITRSSTLSLIPTSATTPVHPPQARPPQHIKSRRCSMVQPTPASALDLHTRFKTAARASLVAPPAQNT